jgi:3-hydroxy-9,10-secoandrosta-1,3,5(10)-triene-9,17-dione monooxygenase reductase component
MSFNANEFRTVMGHFATGVTVVTTRDSGGNFLGLTANAVTSVSLDPPLILVCVDKQAESHPAFSASGAYNVNILTKDQEPLSRTFSKSGGDKFNGLGYTLADNGVPVLNGSLAHMACEIRNEVDAGDHTIYIGEVKEMAMDHEANPLLYFRGGYRDLA